MASTYDPLLADWSTDLAAAKRESLVELASCLGPNETMNWSWVASRGIWISDCGAEWAETGDYVPTHWRPARAVQAKAAA